MYRVCITKIPREIFDRQHLTDFQIKKNDILRLFECLQLSESTACCHKGRCGRTVALCILLEKRFSYPYKDRLQKRMQRQVPIVWAKPN